MSKIYTFDAAKPYKYTFDVQRTALLIIDVQKDFVYPDGFGSVQCGSAEIFANVREVVPKIKKVLEVSRELEIQIFHTREGHDPNLKDLASSKRDRQINAPNGHHTIGIGELGPMGRLLIRGEEGHGIVEELQPLPGEVVIDKPGKGAFSRTNLQRRLMARGITHLILCGVTTE
jgi:nicotinamidase-related amidase